MCIFKKKFKESKKCRICLYFGVLRPSEDDSYYIFFSRDFFSFVFLVLGTDYFLAEAVQFIKENVRLQGLNHNISSTTINLSEPHRTSLRLYWVVALLLMGAIVSCVFEVS